jgi:molybdopterin molybdotransferase
MKTFDEALAYLIEKATPTQKTITVSITEALGKTLAEDLISSINVPPHDNSMMDGYAIATSSFETANSFPVSQRIAAGEIGTPLQQGTVARIFTGAAIPANVDAVIMQEETSVLENKNIKINLNSAIYTPLRDKKYPGGGRNIRRKGEDIAKNEIILHQGHLLKAQDLGLITSIGIAEVKVYQPLTIATFTTGNELIEPGNKLETGKIFNANRYVIAGEIPKMGFTLIDLGVVEDTLESTIEAMQKASKIADVVITTGGVSVGEEDHIKPAIEQLGKLDMWKVKMKPGKPLAYGYINDTPFIGLPGNPVSAFATFKLFAKPYLQTMQGQRNVMAEPIWLKANFSTQKPNFRREFARGKLVNIHSETQVELYPNQGSGALVSTVWADGFAVIPEETIIQQGDMVAFYPF